MRHAFAVATLLLVAHSPAAYAGPLKVVEVHWPTFQFLFSPTGVVLTQSTQDINYDVSDSDQNPQPMVLQTRTTVGQSGTPAAGLYRYAYRLNLEQLIVDYTAPPCLQSMRIQMGPIVSALDYDGDGFTGDQVFVATTGGLGSVPVESAEQTGSFVTFTFAPGGVCSGFIGSGKSSFSFGILSPHKPKFVTAKFEADTTSVPFAIKARAPESMDFVIDDIWRGIYWNPKFPPDPCPLDLRVQAVSRNRFGGTLTVHGCGGREPLNLTVEGSVSPRGEITLAGRGGGGRFVARGTLEEEDVFESHFRLTFADGTSEEGMLILALDPVLVPEIIVEGGGRPAVER